jgi:antitoxin VapB
LLLREFIREQRVDALLVSRHENVAWLTAGAVDVRVGLLRETGPASLLVTKDGGSFYLTTNNEAARLADEEFAFLPYRTILRSWTNSDVEASIRVALPNGSIGTDISMSGHKLLNLQPLRIQLTAGEIRRYRWLGTQTAEAVTQVLLSIAPGMTERAMHSGVAHELISRGLLPSVQLEAVDDRICNYPHPVPRAGVLDRFAMLGVCARYGGLTCALTRFVHFGPMAEQLANNFSVVAHVNARVQSATRSGATADELFNTIKDAYTEAGAPGGEQGHHQGGAIGYWEREWIARPGGSETVMVPQTFAWNPSLRGAKCEDTQLLIDDHLETLTSTPNLPEVVTELNGKRYITAGVLLR